MTPETIPQTVLFPDLFNKPLFAQFHQEQASSDGGAILLKAAERTYGLVKALAGCLFDTRAPDKIRHTLADLFGQRIFGIACGHPDCNDAKRLANDPIHKLLLGRDPEAGEPLASQPTLSRFENAVNRCALLRMADELATRVIERHRRRLDGRARCITIDLDPTDDPTHGAQQYTLFNAYYDNWCYLPLLAFVTFDRESEQYLCAALLRHGKAVASEGTVGLLSRLLPLLRKAFPRARFLVRLDGGFASPAVFDFLEAQPRLEYVVAMAKNAVLERHAEPAMLVARAPQLVQRTDRARLHRHRRVPGRHVEPRAPRRDQSRSRPPRRPRAAGQSALRRHEPAADAALHLREGLLRAGRRREPDQGIEGPADRPHELPGFLGEPVACTADGRGLRADAGTAVVRRRHRVRPCAGALAARPAAQARRPGGALGASHRPAPAARDAGLGGVAAHRVRTRSTRRIAACHAARR